MEEMCFVCSKSLSEGPTVVVHRGLKTLRNASVERNDGKIEHLRNVNSIKIHVQCRKEYTRKSSILAVKNVRDEGASTSTSSLKVGSPTCDWSQYTGAMGKHASVLLQASAIVGYAPDVEA